MRDRVIQVHVFEVNRAEYVLPLVMLNGEVPVQWRGEAGCKFWAVAVVLRAKAGHAKSYYVWEVGLN